jgi:hypothetical protein
MRKLILIGGLLTLSLTATAQDTIKYTCTMNNAERVIEVVYSAADSPVPCSVNYSKDGQTQTLWSYENTQGQCEAKAAEFSEKQSTWGWSCAKSADTNAAETAADTQ